MKDDTISRQAALKEIARWTGYIDEDMILRIQTGLKKVPSAPRWIPCKERLPEEMGDYLVCDNCQNIYVNEWITTTTTWSWHYDDGRITAWMPLPEPWKGEKDD